MKKLLLATLIGSSIVAGNTDSVTSDNPRNTLITAIARNDYKTTLKALGQLHDISNEEKQQYLQMADQIIISSMIWHSTHYKQPEIGRDLVASFAYFLSTVIAGAATVLDLGILIDHYEFGHPCTKEKVLAVFLAGLTTYLGYKTIQKLITAWGKPSNRLENALRIRDAIFHYVVTSPDWINNNQGAIAIGSVALQYPQEINFSAYGTAVGCVHLNYGEHTWSEACNNCKCIACKSAIVKQQASEYHIIGYESYALGSSALDVQNLVGYQSYALGSSALDEQIEQTEE